MFSRFAIIIEASNVQHEQDLPGARRDAEKWISFLGSELGGAWNEEEMLLLHKPASAFVRSLVGQHSQDYVFLAFSGHGFEEYNPTLRKDVTKICLNDYERAVTVDAIAPFRLGTIVLDCCRGFENTPGSFSLANESCLANRGTTSYWMNADPYRMRRRRQIAASFLQAIADMKTHAAVRMYSCSRNEAAGEDPNAGGYYTTLLMDGARIWGNAREANPSYGIYSTMQAHDYAYTAMKEINPQQHPEYTPPWQWYPFAVG